VNDQPLFTVNIEPLILEVPSRTSISFPLGCTYLLVVRKGEGLYSHSLTIDVNHLGLGRFFDSRRVRGMKRVKWLEWLTVKNNPESSDSRFSCKIPMKNHFEVPSGFIESMSKLNRGAVRIISLN
jgi:hypothetical protein